MMDLRSLVLSMGKPSSYIIVTSISVILDTSRKYYSKINYYLFCTYEAHFPGQPISSFASVPGNFQDKLRRHLHSRSATSWTNHQVICTYEAHLRGQTVGSFASVPRNFQDKLPRHLHPRSATSWTNYKLICAGAAQPLEQITRSLAPTQRTG